MNSSSDKKVVVVTGAAAGIGKACALRFAREQFDVLLTDIDGDGLATVAGSIGEHGGEALAVAGDIAEISTSQDCAAAAISRWGRIDVLVANAGTQMSGSLVETSEACRDRILGINLIGVANSCQAILPAMMERASGAIVITSSINAMLASAGMAIYDASKAAVLGLMRSLAVEYGGTGIRVNAVCPGATITDFHIDRFAQQGISLEQLREMTDGYGALGRAARPEEIAAAIYFLASEEASFITGHSLVVDGGFSIKSEK